MEATAEQRSRNMRLSQRGAHFCHEKLEANLWSQTFQWCPSYQNTRDCFQPARAGGSNSEMARPLTWPVWKRIYNVVICETGAQPLPERQKTLPVFYGDGLSDIFCRHIQVVIPGSHRQSPLQNCPSFCIGVCLVL